MNSIGGLIGRTVYGRAARGAFMRVMDLQTSRALRVFEADSRRFAAVNEQALTTLLHRHRRTEFGRNHRFAAILATTSPFEEYRRRVPLSRYGDYEEPLARMAGGERNVLVADPVIFFAPSSGTTGNPKMIPVTAHSMRHTLQNLMLSRAVFGQIQPGADTAARGISLVRMADNLTATAAGIPTGDASAAGMRRAAWIIPYLYTTPLVALHIEDKPSAMFVHLVFGLLERDLSHISATFANYVIYLFRTLEERWPDILDTIASGRLPADLVMTARERGRIEALLRPDPAIAEALRPECARGFRDIARRLWPNFRFIAAASTGSFAAYLPKLRDYVGDVPVLNLLYGATEACMGINLSAGSSSNYALIPRSCVYEFIPVEYADDAQPQAVGLEQLQQGCQYEMVITSDAGFYRYRMDDVVRVTGFHHAAPLIEFEYRRGTLLNVAAEKTTEKQVADAVGALEGRWLGNRGRLVDYTVVADTLSTAPRYRFFLELDTGLDLRDAALHSEAAQVIDAELAAGNVDFRLMRRARAIGPPIVEFVEPGTFEQLLGRLRTGNTLKIPRVISKPELVEFLTSKARSCSQTEPVTVRAPDVD